MLAWARRMEAQRAQRALTEAIKDSKDFDAVNRHKHKNNTSYRGKSNRKETLINCKY